MILGPFTATYFAFLLAYLLSRQFPLLSFLKKNHYIPINYFIKHIHAYLPCWLHIYITIEIVYGLIVGFYGDEFKIY